MKNICVSYLHLLIILGTIFCINLYSCRITLTNDTASKLSVFDLNNDEMIIIPPHKTKTFSDPKLHAHFKFFIKSGETRTFRLVGIYQQTTCGENMFFKASELLNRSERVTSFFDIKQTNESTENNIPQHHEPDPEIQEEEMSEIF